LDATTEQKLITDLVDEMQKKLDKLNQKSDTTPPEGLGFLKVAGIVLLVVAVLGVAVYFLWGNKEEVTENEEE
jgi:uncharacterized membrane protein YukC